MHQEKKIKFVKCDLIIQCIQIMLYHQVTQNKSVGIHIEITV